MGPWREAEGLRGTSRARTSDASASPFGSVSVRNHLRRSVTVTNATNAAPSSTTPTSATHIAREMPTASTAAF